MTRLVHKLLLGYMWWQPTNRLELFLSWVRALWFLAKWAQA